jgi:hypothetical protein
VNRRQIAFGVAFTLMLAGCGGGGSGGSSPTLGPAPFQANVVGVASKGVMQNAIVTAYELLPSGGRGVSVGTATTGPDGRYDLTINNTYTQGRALLLEMTPGDSTTMICDTRAGCGDGIGFGNAYRVGQDFRLTSIRPSVSNGATVNAHITPFTHMKSALILSRQDASTDAILRAAYRINQLLGSGVDVLTTDPVDITAADFDRNNTNDAALIYAFFNAGVARLIFGRDDDKSPEAVLTNFAKAFEDGVLDANDDIPFTAIVEAIGAEVNANPEIPLGAVTARINLLRDRAGTFEIKDEEIPASTILNNVAKAKDMVSETRAWINSFTRLEEPLKNLGMNLQEAQSALDVDLLATATALIYALDELIDAGLLSKPGTYTLPITDLPGTEGTLEVTESNNVVLLNLSASDQSGLSAFLTINTGLPLAAFQQNMVSPIENLVFSLEGSLTRGGSDFRLQNVTLEVDDFFTINDGIEEDEILDIKRISLNGGVRVTATAKDNTPVGFEGELSLDVQDNLMNAGLNGAFSGTQGIVNASVRLRLSNYGTLNSLLNDDQRDNDREQDTPILAALMVSTDLAVNGFPQARLTVTADGTFSNLDNIDFDDETQKSEINALLAYNNRQLTFKLLRESDDDAGGGIITLRVTNSNNVELSLTSRENLPNDVFGSLRLGAVEVGSVRTLGNNLVRIDYEDGTWETAQ